MEDSIKAALGLLEDSLDSSIGFKMTSFMPVPHRAWLIVDDNLKMAFVVETDWTSFEEFDWEYTMENYGTDLTTWMEG